MKCDEIDYRIIENDMQLVKTEKLLVAKTKYILKGCVKQQWR